MEKGSLRAAIILLSVSYLGPALFCFHNVMNQIGIVSAVVFGFCCIHLFLLTIDIWNYAFKLHPDSEDLSDMIRRNAGSFCSSTHQVLINCLMFIGIIGSMICCSKLSHFLFSLIIKMFEKETPSFESFHQIFVFGLGFVYALLFIKKDMTEFASLSFYSIFFLLFIIAVIIYQTPEFFNNLKKHDKAFYNFYQFNLEDFLMSYGVILYSLIMISSFY